MDDEHTEIVRIADQPVVIAYDPEADIWYVRSSAVPGLASEAPTRSALIEGLEALVRTALMP